MKKFVLFGLLALLVMSTGCSRIAKVKATESDLDTPYQSLGTLEIKERVPRYTAAKTLWTGVEVATLSLANTPSRGEVYKKRMNSLLVKKAKDLYGADDVIKVTYWPDPASSKFPGGILKARGEMIKYAPFPEAASEAEIVPTAPVVM